jgi:hypothetical protein
VLGQMDWLRGERSHGKEGAGDAGRLGVVGDSSDRNRTKALLPPAFALRRELGVAAAGPKAQSVVLEKSRRCSTRYTHVE